MGGGWGDGGEESGVVRDGDAALRPGCVSSCPALPWRFWLARSHSSFRHSTSLHVDGALMRYRVIPDRAMSQMLINSLWAICSHCRPRDGVGRLSSASPAGRFWLRAAWVGGWAALPLWIIAFCTLL